MFYISDIKEQAKRRLTGEWGSGILYVIGPGIVATIIMYIFSAIVPATSVGTLVFTQFVSTTINAIAGFMTVNLLVQFVRYDPEIDFFASVGPANKLGKYFLFQIILFVLTLVLTLVLLFALFSSIFAEREALFELYSNLSNAANLSASQNELIASLVAPIIGFVVLLWVFTLIITIRFMFVPYIIVNEEISVFEAITQSWEITKGKFFKIILFEISFIGWYLLGMITCGLALLYTVPYHQVSKTVLYFELSGFDVRPSKLFEEKLESENLTEVNLAEKAKEDDPFEM